MTSENSRSTKPNSNGVDRQVDSPSGSSVQNSAGHFQPQHLKAWKRLSSRDGDDLQLFKYRWDEMQHPVSLEIFQRLVLETPDWVNIVAQDSSGDFVIVKQFRFGTGAFSAEIPGGMVDKGEDSLSAAKRELLEETGYAGSRWNFLGKVEANPAFHNNHCHHWWLQDAEQVAPASLDSGEDIELALFSAEELVAGVNRGEICHPLVISALSRLLDLRSK